MQKYAHPKCALLHREQNLSKRIKTSKIEQKTTQNIHQRLHNERSMNVNSKKKQSKNFHILTPKLNKNKIKSTQRNLNEVVYYKKIVLNISKNTKYISLKNLQISK